MGKKIKTHSRYNTGRKILIFWTLFIGLGAVLGASCMLIEPDGSILQMDGMLPHFQVLPFSDILFSDYVFSGFALLAVNGITNLTAAFLLFRRRKSGVVLATLFGVTLMLWICIQFVIFPMNFMSTAYFIFGLAQAVTGWATLIFYKQEQFSFDEKAYGNVGNNHDELVVYFSRMGYTKKVAYEVAQRSGAEIYEIRCKELIQGTKGFWWCGRYAMHRWQMPIETPDIDLSSYKKVVICSPIWVFELAAPVYSFCKQATGKIQRADYIVVHHMNRSFVEVAKGMDSVLGLKHDSFFSIRCRKGKYKQLEVKQ